MTGIAYLSTKVTNSSENWWKLKRLMIYLKNTANEVCRLEARNTQSIQWYVDAAFAVHKDFRSHTEAVRSLGKGIISSVPIPNSFPQFSYIFSSWSSKRILLPETCFIGE